MCAAGALRPITFLTSHHWASARRAGFHALAQAFLDDGWAPRFVTTGISRLSLRKVTPQIAHLRKSGLNVWVTGSDGVQSFIYCPTVHPVATNAALNPLTDRAFAAIYRTSLPESFWKPIENSAVVVFESNASLLLFDQIARRMPNVRTVYRVSDDPGVIGAAPSIQAASRAVARKADLVSVPSRLLLKEVFANCPVARFHPHGIDLARLKAASAAPPIKVEDFSCVHLGTTLFDRALLERCARARPDITFQIVGSIDPGPLAALPNIRWWGERPFEEALRIAASCDIASAFYRQVPGAAYLAETSNKIAQYRYFGKPVLIPEWLGSALTGDDVVTVPDGDANHVGVVFDRALELASKPAPARSFPTWASVRDAILTDLGVSL